MSEQPESVVLVCLRRLHTRLDVLADEMHDVKHRLTAVEMAVSNLAEMQGRDCWPRRI